MKKKRIAGLVVALGVLAGSAFGFNALAAGPASDTTLDQEWSGGRGYRQMMEFGEGSGSIQERFSNGFGGMMRGFRSSGADDGFFGGMHGGRGMHGMGYFRQELTDEEQEQLQTIREEMQTAMTEYQDRIQEASEAFRAAVETENKDTILTAWNDLKTVREEVQAALEPYRAQMEELLGEDFSYMFRGMDESRLDDIMAELETADPEESQEILEDLKGGTGFAPMGGRGPGVRGSFGGFGGRSCHGNRR